MDPQIEPTANDCATGCVSRRTFLAAGAVAAGAAGLGALTGCGSQASRGTRSAAAAGAPTGAASAPQAVAKVSDVPVGDAISAVYQNGPILISQPAAGEIVAFTAVCTHAGCTVEPAGKEFHCPCHGSVYDAATGKVMQGPAPKALRAIPAHVVNGEVMIG